MKRPLRARHVTLALTAALTAALSAAPPDAKYKAPRTEFGQPDLRGVWNFSSDVPLERPSSVADKRFFTPEEFETQRTARDRGLRTVAKFAPVEDVGLFWMDHTAHVEDLRTSLITYPDNGKLPALAPGIVRLPGAQEILAALSDPKTPPPVALLASFGGGKKDGPEDFSNSERCLFSGNTPIVPDLDNNFLQILQSADHVVLMTDSTRRIVPLDGRPHASQKLRSWSGDSRGHWDGDVLVVETTNFNNRTRSFAGAGTAENKVLTERFTRRSASGLTYEATIVDLKTFQDKVAMSFPMAKSDSRVYETACHEHNYSMSNMLSGARAEERR